MNQELKPCPFCGGKPYVETRHRVFIKSETVRAAFVRCTNCNARTGRMPLKEYGSAAAVNGAIEAWNRRIENVPISQHNQEKN